MSRDTPRSTVPAGSLTGRRCRKRMLTPIDVTPPHEPSLAATRTMAARHQVRGLRRKAEAMTASIEDWLGWRQLQY